MFLSFWVSSFILIILLLFRLSLFQWSTTTGGQDETDGNAGRDGGAGRHDRYVFCYSFSSYSPLFFFSLLLLIFFVADYSNRRGGDKWDGTRRDKTDGNSNADGAGGRLAGGEVEERRKAG